MWSDRRAEEKNDWIAAGAINADLTSGVIDCRGRQRLCLGLIFSPTGDPIGKLYVQGSTGGVLFTALPLALGTVYTNDPANIIHATGDDLTLIDIDDPAAAATLELVILNPLPYMRVFYDRTSGGDAAGLSGYYVLD
jgi:hypothetical protein